jgi:hypothetical protein
MASLKFLADADVNGGIVRGLRRREPAIDFLDASQGQVIGLSDPEVLALAATVGRVVISHDCNTMPAYFFRFIQDHESPGLIIASQSLSIGAAIEALVLFWASTTAQQIQNQVRHLRAAEPLRH